MQIKQTGGFDSAIMIKVLNRGLYTNLVREWEYIESKYKKRLKKLEELEDFEDF